VREGDDGETGTPCGLATSLHGKILCQDKSSDKNYKDNISSRVCTSAQPEDKSSAKTPEA
jgi:hypothetical protein